MEGWSETAPTEPGWYWRLTEYAEIPQAVLVFSRTRRATCPGQCWFFWFTQALRGISATWPQPVSKDKKPCSRSMTLSLKEDSMFRVEEGQCYIFFGVVGSWIGRVKEK